MNSDFFRVAKERTEKAAAFVGDAAKSTGQSLQNAVKQKDWSKEKEAWDSLRTQAAAGSQFLARQATATVKRMGFGLVSVEARSKQESQATPCPRAILVCCNYIVGGNMQQKGIFKEDGPEDILQLLCNLIEKGNGVTLIPKGTSPNTAAGAIKQYLRTLEEPLLTYKLVPEFLSAGMGESSRATALLSQLPPANYNTLVLLIDCAKRVAENSGANYMTARHIAEELAPCVMWHPLPKDMRETPDESLRLSGPLQIQLLSEKELIAAANVVEALINAP